MIELFEENTDKYSEYIIKLYSIFSKDDFEHLSDELVIKIKKELKDMLDYVVSEKIKPIIPNDNGSYHTECDNIINKYKSSIDDDPTMPLMVEQIFEFNSAMIQLKNIEQKIKEDGSKKTIKILEDMKSIMENLGIDLSKRKTKG